MIGRASVAFVLLFGASAGAAAQVCDPPGPPPRWGCFWSTDSCQWLCAVCDPYGAAPRTNCSWDLQVCNWICPGYTGTDVTVMTTHTPTRVATVYVRLMSVCTQTGASGSCGGSFAVSPALSIAQKCGSLAEAVTANCASVGYSVSTNACASLGTFTASNIGCPGTQFALGISNDAGDFDESDQPSLPDGESETVQGSCHPMAGAVSRLRLDKANGGAQLLLTWDAASDAATYTVFEDASRSGGFTDVAGTTASAQTSATIPMPAGLLYFVVAGSNATCGSGPK